MESDPPFQVTYKTLLDNYKAAVAEEEHYSGMIVEATDLPVIDLSRLLSTDLGSREECKKEIAEASKEWGFFQVVNHGISREILERMYGEQVKAFRQPFDKKAKEKLLNFPGDSYRWGTPNATHLTRFSWSEAFHIPLTHMSGTGTEGEAAQSNIEFNSIWLTIQEFAKKVSSMALIIAEILAEKLDHKTTFFRENCKPNTCYLRLNRYPPCPISTELFGLMPHTDSDFLTVLYQDQVGGLQLVKDGKWIMVQPNPDALIVNIGDLFQAWSNDVYKSVEHRVMANRNVERFSVAYFFCPSYDTAIQSCKDKPIYKEFSFREFRRQVQQDVRTVGYKVGLPRFLL